TRRHLTAIVTRRPASIAQADVARAIRAARQTGAEAIEVRRDGTIIVLLKAPSVAPADEFEAWEREYESEKASRRRERD
ncbi:MAG TPA: hypothetical protein VKR55_06700, partial [Bradyrhizobium sp.]|uniref:hypothetical protein n=1 Tax=Bradyrhizobium sp. TaxID=376 RepID=UPI002BC1277D